MCVMVHNPAEFRNSTLKNQRCKSARNECSACRWKEQARSFKKEKKHSVVGTGGERMPCGIGSELRVGRRQKKGEDDEREKGGGEDQGRVVPISASTMLNLY